MWTTLVVSTTGSAVLLEQSLSVFCGETDETDLPLRRRHGASFHRRAETRGCLSMPSEVLHRHTGQEHKRASGLQSYLCCCGRFRLRLSLRKVSVQRRTPRAARLMRWTPLGRDGVDTWRSASSTASRFVKMLTTGQCLQWKKPRGQSPQQARQECPVRLPHQPATRQQRDIKSPGRAFIVPHLCMRSPVFLVNQSHVLLQLASPGYLHIIAVVKTSTGTSSQ